MDGGSRNINYLKYFRGKLPGRVISGDEQCKEQYGEGVFQCKQALVRNKWNFGWYIVEAQSDCD